MVPLHMTVCMVGVGVVLMDGCQKLLLHSLVVFATWVNHLYCLQLLEAVVLKELKMYKLNLVKVALVVGWMFVHIRNVQACL